MFYYFFTASTVEGIAVLMYQSNRSLNISPRAYPGHLTSLAAREGGNFMKLVFPGAGISSLLMGGGEFDR